MGVANLPTAFVARYKGNHGAPNLGIIVEYDALRGLGHARGHNLVCTASVGAAAALHRTVPLLRGTPTSSARRPAAVR